MDWKCYIPERFEKEIVLHALRVGKADIKQSPIMLAIDGPAGEGKTYQCEMILNKIGLKVFSLSAGQFENVYAGEPAKLIRETYDNAINYVERSGKYAAILIDDADVAFGNWGEMVNYTVNTQGVLGELMNIANMSISDKEGNRRIPIYLTGNDLQRIYSPLRRSGRMEFFYWEPNTEEKADMIYHMFDFLTRNDILELIKYVNELCEENDLKKEPIAFYSTLLSHMWDDKLWDLYINYRNTCFNKRVFYALKFKKVNEEKGIEFLKQQAKKQVEQKLKARISYLQ